jgi:hypothetical protein
MRDDRDCRDVSVVKGNVCRRRLTTSENNTRSYLASLLTWRRFASRDILVSTAPPIIAAAILGSRQYLATLPALKGRLWVQIRDKIFKNYALKSLDAVRAKLKHTSARSDKCKFRPT